MKKMIAAFSATCFALTLFAGCQATPNGSDPSVNSAREISSTEIGAVSIDATRQHLTADEAKAAALAHAKVNADLVQDFEIELDKEKDVLFYDISFDADGLEYDYEIEVYTGEILNSKSEQDPQPQQSPASSETNPQRLTADEAKAAALAHAKVNADLVQDFEIELDKEKDVLFYDISFDVDGLEYDYEIEAYTGEILNSKSSPEK